MSLKRVFLASLALSGVGFWALGSWLGHSSLSDREVAEGSSETRAEQREKLGRHLDRFSQVFNSSLQAVKNEALLLRAEPNRMDSQRKVLLLAEAPIEGNALGAIATFYHRSQRDFPEAIERTLLDRIYAKLHHAPSMGLDLYPVRPDESRPEEELWMTFRDQNVEIFALIEPTSVFELTPQEENTRAYLVSESGSVLAHTLPSLNGTSIAGSPVYSKATSAAQTGDAAETVGFEGTPVLAQFRRVGNFPLQLAVEEKLPIHKAQSSWELMSQLIRIAKALFAILAFYCAFRAFEVYRSRSADRVALKQSRTLEKEVAAARKLKTASKDALLGALHSKLPPAQLPKGAAPQVPVPRSGAVVFARPDFSQVDSRTSVLAPPRASLVAAVHAQPPPPEASALKVDALAGPVGTMVGGKIIAAQAPSQILEPLDEEAYESQLRAMKAELMSYQQALKLSQHESELLAEFESEAARLRDPKLVSVRMVSVAARLCASPALFFGYEDRLRLCRVLAESGVGAGRIDAGSGFVVHESTLQWLQAEVSSGRWPSLTEYPPLAKLLLERLGVAYFEAWPLMGNGPLGRMSGKPRLLGVLVILQSGVDSYAKKDSLKRMLRSTGLIYENTLLAR